MTVISESKENILRLNHFCNNNHTFIELTIFDNSFTNNMIVLYTDVRT